ncbi:ABC transporter substrate-binding protein [Candidatus Aalborgicola defluviihabitans]|uniref:ABC transporter substrate-binding protein n=1 Tax=Candidatus Aalborgicola defluviihabitans TaxID=3386187 RepID=UPI001D4602DC|nr:ABC transporter substrate-binding protein [Burkholderiales bacterium]MBK6567898.1 ABC transporter substrate-binding protein [Burkholderiales bacterium]MBK7282058.1 ABC transporter substrate-binding protein [Burkholderiales bacterium]MBL0244555.1 ABC transporter substrate-binding protein [Rhodoferax sp.]
MGLQSPWLLPCLGLALCLGLGSAKATEAGVTDTEILIGQPAPLTGPLAELAPDIVNATKALFDGVNEKGGIHGRKLRTLTMDDGYVVENTVKVVNHMIDKEPVFALINMTGTSNVASVLPLLEKTSPPLPLVAPFTGADLIRVPPIHHVFNVRASYGDEAEKIVQHLTTIGTQRIAVLWSNNGFGKDGLAGVQRALEKRGMKVYANAPIEQNASDTNKAVAALYDTRPEVIVMVTAGAPTVSFIKAYNKVRKGMQFYTLSVMGNQATLRALGADGVGVVVSTVVPFPWDVTHPLAREYRAAMQKAGFASNISFLGFESYINGKVLVEGLRLAGKDLNRKKFVDALASMRRLDMGGFAVGFSKDSRQGSRFVGLTIVSPGERFTK